MGGRRLPAAPGFTAGCVAGRMEDGMSDVAFVALVVVFFGVSWAYARACDRL